MTLTGMPVTLHKIHLMEGGISREPQLLE
jgi:hypothetical protein